MTLEHVEALVECGHRVISGEHNLFASGHGPLALKPPTQNYHNPPPQYRAARNCEVHQDVTVRVYEISGVPTHPGTTETGQF
jgi:hypothetical protein